MAKTKLSISLLKDGVTQENAIKDGIGNIQLPNGNFLYYKHTNPRTPQWINNFFGDAIQDANQLMTKSVSALIFFEVEVEEGNIRTFVICFGYGRNLLKPDVTERRFGLITVLNQVDEEMIRSVDTSSLGATPRNNRTQTSLLSNMIGFNIDTDKDILKSVAGKASENDYFSGMLSGTDVLSLSTDLNYDGMNEFLVNCYQTYIRTDYRDKFPWIDKMTEIKDKNTIEGLVIDVLERLNMTETENVWISIPEIVDYEMDYFKLQSDNHFSDLVIQNVKEEIQEEFTLELLKKKQVSCYSADDNFIKSWSLYRCLYVEIRRGNDQYLLNDGKWYKVSSDFVQETNDYYQNIPLADIDLPNYANNIHEDEYNQDVCNNNGFCLMDKQLIRYGGSRIEFCDIYTGNRELIHVKKYKGSAVLSHLFFQGFVSAESFLESQFRGLVNEKMGQLGYGVHIPVNIDEFDPKKFTVIFAIAKNEQVVDGRKPDIPFFSKVSLKTVSNRLMHYGYNVKMKFI